MRPAQPALLVWVYTSLALLLSVVLSAPAGAADGPAPAVIVFDSSGSMAAVLPSARTKLDTARSIVTAVLMSWPAGGQVGLIAYGHRRKSDCSDIETMLPLGPLSRDAVSRALKPLIARGKTPLSRSLEAAAKLLPVTGGTIVLVSDGVETCDADPCAVAAALKAASASLVIHVVGFGLQKEEFAQLACIAERSGGMFFDAKDAAGLTKALDTVKRKSVAPPPEPTPPQIVPRANEKVQTTSIPEPPKAVRTFLSAVAGGLGAIVDTPVRWAVNDASGTSVYEGESRTLVLDLLPGPYKVTAAAANATGARAIEVVSGHEQTFEVAVEAGRLELSVAPSPNEPAYTDAEAQGLMWSLESLAGQPPAIVPPVANPSLLLSPGPYRIRAELKGLKAEAQVDVKSGVAYPLALTFRMGRLALEAALEGETEPLEDGTLLHWRIADGAMAQRIDGQPRPSLTLPEGTYGVVLNISGFDVTARAEVKAGQNSVLRVVVPGGTLGLAARLGPNSTPLDDWRDTSWVITPVKALGTATPIESHEPTPNLSLPAGRWHVTLKSGMAIAEQDVSIVPGGSMTLDLQIGAARLSIEAERGDGEANSNVVYAVTAVDLSGMASPEPIFEVGSSEGTSIILPAGLWRITADDTEGRHAETKIDLAAGEERSVSLMLQATNGNAAP
jgi:Ca-activated chloride channel homolog